MSDKTKMRIKLAKQLLQLKDLVTNEGAVLTVEGELVIGAEVYTMDDAGEVIPASDGVYTAEGVTYEVAGGVITAITENKEEEETIEEEKPTEEMAAEEESTEETTEEETTEEPTEEPTEDVEALKARISELEAENEALKAVVEEFKRKEETALGKPLDEIEKENKQNNSTSDLRDRMARLAKRK